MPHRRIEPSGWISQCIGSRSFPSFAISRSRCLIPSGGRALLAFALATFSIPLPPAGERVGLLSIDWPRRFPLSGAMRNYQKTVILCQRKSVIWLVSRCYYLERRWRHRDRYRAQTGINELFSCSHAHLEPFTLPFAHLVCIRGQRKNDLFGNSEPRRQVEEGGVVIRRIASPSDRCGHHAHPQRGCRGPQLRRPACAAKAVGHR